MTEKATRPLFRMIALVMAMALAAASSFAASPASAQSIPPPTVYIVNAFEPSTQWDLFMDGEPNRNGIEGLRRSGQLSPAPNESALSAGSHTIELFDKGITPSTGSALASIDIDIVDGASYSIAIHPLPDGTPTLSFYDNPTEPVATNRGRVIIRHVAAAGTLDVRMAPNGENSGPTPFSFDRTIGNGDQIRVENLYVNDYEVQAFSRGAITASQPDTEVEAAGLTIVWIMGNPPVDEPGYIKAYGVVTTVASDTTAEPTVTTSDSSGVQDGSNGANSSIGRLYVAYFEREPDTDGLNYWQRQQSNGLSIIDISNFFASSDEFANTYGNTTDAEFVELVYQNVLDRSPDPDGESYWLGQLDQRLTRGQLMLYFSESAEFRRKTA